MKIFNAILGIVMAGNSIAQINTSVLDQNNTSGVISDHGFFFNNPTNNSAGYEVPSGSGNHAIYSGAFWFKANDVNGARYLIASDLYGASYDLKPGPCLDVGVPYSAANPLNETIWTVSKVEIENHILNFDQPGYVIPNSIENWPAHGDSSAGYSFYLAPFVDANYNGVYEPVLGDYPCVKGDKAIYTILNDYMLHGSGGQRFQVEIHYMFYQFSSDGFLNNTTFIDIDVLNKSANYFYDFKMSFVQDGDLGNPYDDFYGCDSSLNMIYSYNGDAMDENSGGVLGYGLNAPSVGMVCLSHEMESAMSFTDNGGFPDLYPSTAQEIWNVMEGKWASGTDIIGSTGQPTKFQYSGNPNNANEWSELSSGNLPGNRKSIITVNDNPVLYPLDGHKSFTCAIIYDRSGNSEIENVNGLLAVADSVQSFYDLHLTNQCGPVFVSADELEELDFSMYPNPSNGAIHVEIANNLQYDLVVQDMSGREIYSDYGLIGHSILDLSIPSGVYIIHVNSGGLVAKRKLIIK